MRKYFYKSQSILLSVSSLCFLSEFLFSCFFSEFFTEFGITPAGAKLLLSAIFLVLLFNGIDISDLFLFYKAPNFYVKRLLGAQEHNIILSFLVFFNIPVLISFCISIIFYGVALKYTKLPFQPKAILCSFILCFLTENTVLILNYFVKKVERRKKSEPN